MNQASQRLEGKIEVCRVLGFDPLTTGRVVAVEAIAQRIKKLTLDTRTPDAETEIVIDEALRISTIHDSAPLGEAVLLLAATLDLQKRTFCLALSFDD